MNVSGTTCDGCRKSVDDRAPWIGKHQWIHVKIERYSDIDISLDACSADCLQRVLRSQLTDKKGD